MLGKLIKYDFRSCWKKFWLVWLGVIAVSIINGITIRISDKYNDYSFALTGIPKLILFGIAVAAIVIALLYIYNEFRHGLLGNAGYLSFTLPVKVEELIGSKAIVALIMEAISAVVVVISGLLIAFIVTPDIPYLFTGVLKWFEANNSLGLIIAFVLELIVLMAASAFAFNFHIYTAVSVGHLSKKHHRIIGLVTFILLCVLSIQISVKLVGITGPVYDMVVGEWEHWQTSLTGFMAALGVIILAELVYSAIMFVIVRFILKNKLNLE